MCTCSEKNSSYIDSGVLTMSYKILSEFVSNHGVTACFGIPGGGESLDIISYLEDEGVSFYLSHFEGSAAIMAATTGKLSSTVGLSVSIKGPGLTNALPGIALAWFESLPLIHIAESTPVSAPSWVAHKRLPQKQLCTTVIKASGYLSSGGTGIEEAGNIAIAEEPGPVLLEIGSGPVSIQPEVVSFNNTEYELSGLFNCIRNCCKPIVIAGAISVRQGLGVALSSLTIPVFSTVAAKGVIDESLDFAAGIYTGVGEELTPEQALLSESDLIICIGLSEREVLITKPFPCPAIQVGAQKTEGLEGFKFNWFLETKYTLEILADLSNKTWGLKDVLAAKRRIEQKLLDGFLPGRAFRIIEQHYLGAVRIVLDTGYFCTVGEHVWRAKRPDWCLLSAQARYMGTSLPMALAAAIYDKSVPTVVVVGDGGIGMYIADIKLAVQYSLPLMVVLMSDGGFGSIRPRAREKGLSLKPIQTDGKSWVSIMNSFGIPGDRVETEQEFEYALRAWDALTGPAFIEIQFKPDAYEKITIGIRA